MAIQLVVPGRVVETLPVPHREIPGARVLAVATVTGVARAGEKDPTVTLPPDVAKEDVVLELDLGDGVRQWSSLTQLEVDGVAIPETVRDGGVSGAIRILPTVRHREGTRGLGKWALKALKILHIDPARQVSRKLIAGKFEDRLDVGFKGLDIDGAFTNVPPLEGAEPYLLFIHGTASATHSAFGQLFVKTDQQNAEYLALFDTYKGRVLAFEHKTLGVGPIANTIELAEVLPANARLHIVTHSRGGLIGELLCLDPKFDKSMLQAFDGTGHADHLEQKKQLADLQKILGRKKLRIEKFVRIACPA